MSIVILGPDSIPLERYTLDVSKFPQEGFEYNERSSEISWGDIKQEYRSTLVYFGSLAQTDAGVAFGGPLPPSEECTFTVTVQVPENQTVDASCTDFPWIAPEFQTQGQAVQKVRPIRYTSMGLMSFNFWMEETPAKSELVSSLGCLGSNKLD